MNLSKFESQWFALQVRNRKEHVCAQILRSKGYEEFLPIDVTARGDASRRATAQPRALFPGYVFCRLRANASGLIVTTPGVIRVVGYGGVPCPISEEEIENIQRLVSSGRPTWNWPYVPAGQRFRITRGPLRGVTGKFVRAKNAHTLIVSIDLLQRSAAVEVDVECVATADLVTGNVQATPRLADATGGVMSLPVSDNRPSGSVFATLPVELRHPV